MLLYFHQRKTLQSVKALSTIFITYKTISMQKKFFTSLIMVLAILWSLKAQTSLRVNQILQEKCASCHSGMSPAASLDLSGGASDMMANLVNVTPANAHAASEGYDLIYPGRADKSYLFRLVQDGLEPFIEMDAAEMPTTAHDEALGLTDTEKELIRQWILFGARLNGTAVDEALLEDYYNNGGMESFPNGRPAAPDPSEGFQIKMGPFFLAPAGNGGEEEYFQKYELDNEEAIEITRINNFMDGNSSHHFILYDYNSTASAAGQQAGFRPNPDHFNVGLVEAIQDPVDLVLPEGSAFFWNANKVLDLNSHYINFHSVPYKSEVYANIYFQQSGIASQEMHAELLAKTNICIPNNGDLYTQEETINFPFGDIYLWALSGHTHQLGKSYKIWRSENNQPTELLYDAACYAGMPGCVSPLFDYRHIPFRYFDNLLPVNMSFVNGLKHEASWINNTDEVVCWGDESDDEMMVMIVMFLTDIDGIVTDVENPEAEIDILDAYPNPMTESAIIQLPEDTGTVDLILYDVLGNQIRAIRDIRDNQITIERENLPAGIYVYHLKNEAGKLFSGKILMQ